MSTGNFDPPFTPVDRLVPALRQDGYAVLSPQGVAQWLGSPLEQLELLHADWNQLPLDEYLKDGGRYRTRRHACFMVEAAIIEQVSGQTYDEYLRDEILAPLGLKDTGFLLPRFDLRRLAHGYRGEEDRGTMLAKPHAADGPYWNL